MTVCLINIVCLLNVNLEPNDVIIFFRYGNFDDFMKHIDNTEGGILNFASGFKSMGCQGPIQLNFSQICSRS